MVTSKFHYLLKCSNQKRKIFVRIQHPLPFSHTTAEFPKSTHDSEIQISPTPLEPTANDDDQLLQDIKSDTQHVVPQQNSSYRPDVDGLRTLAVLPSFFMHIPMHFLVDSLASISSLSSLVTYFDIDIKTNPLLHLWSLGVEEQFYIFWPLLASVVMKLPYRQAVMVQIGVLVTSFLINVGFLGYHDNNKVSFYMPLSRFWQMSMGGLLAYVSKHTTMQSYKGVANDKEEDGEKTTHWSSSTHGMNILSVGGLVLILIGFACINEERMFPGFWAVLPTAGATMLITAGKDGVVNQYVLSHPVAVYIGKISYCLYLWHWPLLVFAKERYPNVDSRPFFMAPYVMVLVSLVLSVLTYEDVEKRLRRHKSKVVTPLLVLGVVVLGILALCVYTRPESYSSIELELAQSTMEEEDVSLDFVSSDVMDSESSSNEVLSSGEVLSLNDTWTMVKSEVPVVEVVSTEAPIIAGSVTPVVDQVTVAPTTNLVVVDSTLAVATKAFSIIARTVTPGTMKVSEAPLVVSATSVPKAELIPAPHLNSITVVVVVTRPTAVIAKAPVAHEVKKIISAPAAVVPVISNHAIKKQHGKSTSYKDVEWDVGSADECPANSKYMTKINLDPPIPYRGNRTMPIYDEKCQHLNPDN
ncbi:acyltransferase [Thraustotheca clavata]|uniref:Acyltransferase n=1 Tax=Thraustotheca clavata TaxID=74557 RepID=A0A1W0A3Y4_9STRA|nr:acyltransferase [Thraustotheca clavata]